MSLPGQQLDRICEAIRAAYTPESLARMLRMRLDVRLYDVAGGEDFRVVVFRLVEWADRQQRLPQLVGAALAENPANRDLMEVAAALGIAAPAGGPRSAALGPWYVPFERNPAFFGRTEDLDRLHAALAPRGGDGGQAIVGIRPAGVTGMGGMGKTQLAVEYAYRHRGEYPGGVFWLNAAGDWRAEFAGLGMYLDVSRVGEPQEAQVRAAADYLGAHADCLLVLDNVEDPQQLRWPVTRYLLPSALPCAVLFTTRRHDLGNFRPVELPVLPEEPGLQLLLRHRSRQAVLAEDHPEHGEALTIYAMLGGLPLALEIAGAHLGRRPAASLQAYREELLRRGALAMVDDPRGGVREEELGTRHAAAVAATLAEQWEGLGEDARLLLRAAGELPEAAAIPLARLGLLVGLKKEGGDFFGDPLRDAAGELVDASLLEDLRDDLVRLHPLVRAFAAQQTPEAEREGFRWEYGSRLIVAYDDLTVLERQCARRGIDAVEGDLLTVSALLGDAGASGPIGASAALLLRAVRQESHTLRGWDAKQNPACFRQQWLKRALLLRNEDWIKESRAFINALAVPHLEVAWTTAQRETSLVRILSGHTGPVYAVMVTPDGRHIVSGSFDGVLRVWALGTGETVHTLAGHTGAVYVVAVTPDGRYAVSGSLDGTLRVWDLRTGERVSTLKGHTDGVRAVAIIPGGRHIVSGSFDNTLRMWDFYTGETVRTFTGHTDGVRTVAVTPDGRHAVSGSEDRTLRVWKLDTGETVCVLTGHVRAVRAVAVTPDGRHAVSCSRDNTLRLWDLASGETVRTLTGHVREVRAVAVTPDGRYAISGSHDRTVRVWDLASSQTVSILSGHAREVSAVSVSPDGRHVVSGSYDKTVRVWDLTNGEPLGTTAGHGGSVNAIATTPDGFRAVSGSSDKTLRVWDLASGETVHTLSGHISAVSAVAVTPDGHHAVSGSFDATLRVWDLDTGETIHTLSGHTHAVRSIAVTPDGRCAVSGSEDRTLRVWILANGETLSTFSGHANWARAVTVTPDGRYAVSGSGDKTLRVWDMASGDIVRVLSRRGGKVRAVAVTPDGRFVVSGSRDKAVRMHDLASDETAQTFRGHAGPVNTVAVAPNGRYVVSGSDDNTLRVWDLAGRLEPIRMVLDLAVHSVAVTQDSHTIVAGDAAGNLWCLRYHEPPL